MTAAAVVPPPDRREPGGSPAARKRETGFVRAWNLAAKAIGRPGSHQISDHTWSWRVSGRCSSPQMLAYAGSTEGAWGQNRFMETILSVRCRKCENCLREKAREWAFRARAEIGFWGRTYFGTLTLSPEEHVRALALAAVELAEEGVDVSTLTDHETFKYRTAQCGKWITTYLKRCRYEMTGAPLRYVVVAEAHKSGLPHFHMLVHEMLPFTQDAWDSYCVLKTQWPHGHCAWEGVGHDQRAAWYVSKYISKSALARVRASARYGDPVSCVSKPT